MCNGTQWPTSGTIKAANKEVMKVPPSKSFPRLPHSSRNWTQRDNDFLMLLFVCLTLSHLLLPPPPRLGCRLPACARRSRAPVGGDAERGPEWALSTPVVLKHEEALRTPGIAPRSPREDSEEASLPSCPQSNNRRSFVFVCLFIYLIDHSSKRCMTQHCGTKRHIVFMECGCPENTPVCRCDN